MGNVVENMAESMMGNIVELETERRRKGAIFDVDGVLLDSMGVWENLGERYLLAQGIEPEPQLGEVLFSMSLPEGAAYLRAHYPIGKTEDEIVAGILGLIQKFYYEEVSLKPGVAAFLERLRAQKVRIAAATSSDRGHVEHAFSRLGILEYFTEIFTCAEVGAGKTEPKIYLAAAEAMGLAPGDCCVYEDALYALQTAKAAGFQTVGVYDRYSREDQNLLKQTADRYVRELG